MVSATARPARTTPRQGLRRGDRRGMSIVELMITLTILGAGILALASLFPFGATRQVSSRLRTSAADLAQQKMEQLHLLTWSDPELSVGTHPSSAGESVQIESEGRFNRKWEVEQLTGSFSDMKRVTVLVTWTFPRPDTVDLVTYFRR